MSGVSELPFLREFGSGYVSYDHGEGNLFDNATELLNSIPGGFPFGNSTETSVYVSLTKVVQMQSEIV